MRRSISVYATAIVLAAGLLGCNLDVPPISVATCTTYVAGTPGPIEIEHEGGTTSLNLWPRLLIASGPFGQYQRALTEGEARSLAEVIEF